MHTKVKSPAFLEPLHEIGFWSIDSLNSINIYILNIENLKHKFKQPLERFGRL